MLRLFQNGTFNQDINLWDDSNKLASWVNNDGANASGNGSIQFGDNKNNNGSLWIRSKFFSVKYNLTLKSLGLISGFMCLGFE